MSYLVQSKFTNASEKKRLWKPKGDTFLLVVCGSTVMLVHINSSPFKI